MCTQTLHFLVFYQDAARGGGGGGTGDWVGVGDTGDWGQVLRVGLVWLGQLLSDLSFQFSAVHS